MSIKVYHLAAADHGGAGVAAIRLHRALDRAGATSRMMVWSKGGDTPGVVTPRYLSAFARARRFWARGWLRATSRRRFFFQDQRLSLARNSGVVSDAVDFKPDLLVAHYISNFVSFSDIAEIQRRTGALVAWHLVDMAPLTGGCHYAWECKGYLDTCGDCPALPLRPRNDASARTIAAKREELADLDQVVVATSTTLVDQARSSAIFRRAEIQKILIGVDEEDVPFFDRQTARDRLGIDHRGIVIFFGTQRLSEERKGMVLLVDALFEARRREPRSPAPLLLVAGDDSDLAGLDGAGYPIHRLGYVNAATLALAYAAGDVFICPSIEDSGPMMINECMRAGTPVVAFNVGVVPDLVEDGLTGVVARNKTASALADALVEFLAWDPPRREAARRACSATAEIRCSSVAQAEAFLSLVGRR